MTARGCPLRVSLRRDTVRAWRELDPVLRENEMVLATDVPGVKIGDGERRFSELPYLSFLTVVRALAEGVDVYYLGPPLVDMGLDRGSA